jgi:threonine dehydrogenase-like Zn-dependent dehydrogenase
MKATLLYGPRDIRVENVPDAQLKSPTDVILRVTHACICGSDLWPYRGEDPRPAGARMGHEFIGVVEAVGAEVATLKPGDWAMAPFKFSDGSCDFCHEGMPTSCRHGGFWGGIDNDGGQGEAVRVPMADATLVKLPALVGEDARLQAACLALTDVMATGHHAAVAAGVRPGVTAAVVGDGAVGLCGVIAAKRLGASRIILMSRHADRQALGRRFGATDIVSERGDEAIAIVQELTKGGAAAVLECVGTQQSLDTAFGIARPGGCVGWVGVPHAAGLPLSHMFLQNIGLRGGIAPARAYMPELLEDVLAGKIDPSPVFDLTIDLAGVPDGYRAMDERKATKVMIRM